MIEKYDGLFFKCLNLILYKYQHYPQLHYNILLIIYHIINDSDSEGLVNNFVMIEKRSKQIGSKVI